MLSCKHVVLSVWQSLMKRGEAAQWSYKGRRKLINLQRSLVRLPASEQINQITV